MTSELEFALNEVEGDLQAVVSNLEESQERADVENFLFAWRELDRRIREVHT